jgi:hypothetical protein
MTNRFKGFFEKGNIRATPLSAAIHAALGAIGGAALHYFVGADAQLGLFGLMALGAFVAAAVHWTGISC